MEEMARLGPTRVKSILECGGKGQGRRCLVSFLLRTGLLKDSLTHLTLWELKKKTPEDVSSATFRMKPDVKIQRRRR